MRRGVWCERVPRFFVCNPLSWTRTDAADYFLPVVPEPPKAGQVPSPVRREQVVHAIDLTDRRETPSQIILRNGQRFLRILARNVLSLGYQVFEIRSGPGEKFDVAASVAGSVIEKGQERLYTVGIGSERKGVREHEQPRLGSGK